MSIARSNSLSSVTSLGKTTPAPLATSRKNKGWQVVGIVLVLLGISCASLEHLVESKVSSSAINPEEVQSIVLNTQLAMFIPAAILTLAGIAIGVSLARSTRGATQIKEEETNYHTTKTQSANQLNFKFSISNQMPIFDQKYFKEKFIRIYEESLYRKEDGRLEINKESLYRELEKLNQEIEFYFIERSLTMQFTVQVYREVVLVHCYEDEGELLSRLVRLPRQEVYYFPLHLPQIINHSGVPITFRFTTEGMPEHIQKLYKDKFIDIYRRNVHLPSMRQRSGTGIGLEKNAVSLQRAVTQFTEEMSKDKAIPKDSTMVFKVTVEHMNQNRELSTYQRTFTLRPAAYPSR